MASSSSASNGYDFLITKILKVKAGKVEQFQGLTSQNSLRNKLRHELASQTKDWLDAKVSQLPIRLYIVKVENQDGKLTHKKPVPAPIAAPSLPRGRQSAPVKNVGIIRNPAGQTRGLSPGATFAGVGMAINGKGQLVTVTVGDKNEICGPNDEPHVHILNIHTKKQGIFKIKLEHKTFKWIQGNIPEQKWTFRHRKQEVYEFLFADAGGKSYIVKGFQLQGGIYYETGNVGAQRKV